MIHQIQNHLFRLCHYGPFYKHIHKKHHEWTASIGIVSHYAHPLEQILSHNIPFELGPILCGSHVWTIWVFGFFGKTCVLLNVLYLRYV